MTVPDHMLKPSEYLLHQTRHPHMPRRLQGPRSRQKEADLGSIGRRRKAPIRPFTEPRQPRAEPTQFPRIASQEPRKTAP